MILAEGASTLGEEALALQILFAHLKQADVSNSAATALMSIDLQCS